MYDMGRATDGSSHSVFSIDVMDIFFMGVDSQNMWVWPFGFGPLQVKRYNRSLCLSVLCKACRAWRGSDKWKSRLLYMFFFSPWFPIFFGVLYAVFAYWTSKQGASEQPTTRSTISDNLLLQPPHVHAPLLLFSLQEYFQMIRLQTAVRTFSKPLYFFRTLQVTKGYSFKRFRTGKPIEQTSRRKRFEGCFDHFASQRFNFEVTMSTLHGNQLAAWQVRCSFIE